MGIKPCFKWLWYTLHTASRKRKSGQRRNYPPHSAPPKKVLGIFVIPHASIFSPYAQCIVANKGAGDKPRVFHSSQPTRRGFCLFVGWVGLGWGGIVGYQNILLLLSSHADFGFAPM